MKHWKIPVTILTRLNITLNPRKNSSVPKNLYYAFTNCLWRLWWLSSPGFSQGVLLSGHFLPRFVSHCPPFYSFTSVALLLATPSTLTFPQILSQTACFLLLVTVGENFSLNIFKFSSVKSKIDVHSVEEKLGFRARLFSSIFDLPALRKLELNAEKAGFFSVRRKVIRG